MTSPYLWVLCLTSVIPSVLWWYNTNVLTFFLFLFMSCYVVLYWRIVRFKTPKWMLIRYYRRVDPSRGTPTSRARRKPPQDAR
jgi:hypothetical protein